MKDIRIQWKALANAKQITREDIAALCLYRTLIKEQGATEALSRLYKSFTPITNTVKLANGADATASLKASLRTIKYSTFAKWFDENEIKTLMTLAQDTLKEDIK